MIRAVQTVHSSADGLVGWWLYVNTSAQDMRRPTRQLPLQYERSKRVAAYLLPIRKSTLSGSTLSPLRRVGCAEYKKTYRKAVRRGKDVGKLEQMLELLETHQQLPARCKVHVLSGDRRGVMSAKIEPDWILLYKIANGELRLFATGTHSDLFG